MFTIAIKGDGGPLQKEVDKFFARQIPFATSLMLNDLAKGVAEVEGRLIEKTFDSPTPFTRNAYRIEVATKSKPIAVVAAKDIQGEWLEPYVVGGERYLGGKKGMIAPRNVSLNQYGNLTKGKLASLKGKPNVFIGPVKTRGGKVINGVWQRPTSAQRRRSKGTRARGGLKLLIQFEDTTPVRKRLPFERAAQVYLQRNARRAFEAAMARAIASARR